MKIRGGYAHRVMACAEDRARHRTPGAKRFVYIAANDRGCITPDYGIASILAMSMVLSIVAKARSAMIRGRGGAR